MATRVLGPTGSRRRRRFLLAPVLMVVLAAIFMVAGAQAVHDDNLFELGGVQAANILGDGNTANGPDWADLFDASGNDNGSATGTFGGVAAAFLKDDTSQKGGTDKTTYSGAGGPNKNNDPPPDAAGAAHDPPLTGSACDTWHWDAGNVPAKDDLVNSYVYAKIPTSGPFQDDLIIYGGLERLDESGDSHIDLEFLQNSVNIVDGAVSGAGAIPCNDPGQDPVPCNFSGIREVNDVIVSMDFVQGGGIGSVEVRRWNGNEYVLEGVEGGEGCDTDDFICAFNNGTSIDGGPWVNIDKTGNEITNLLPNAFTEIGVNVTELLGTTPCISTVMGKTRSSQSFTAELKDFTAPRGFPICSAAISIAPDDVNAVGDSHTFTVTVSKKIGNTSVPVANGQDVNVSLTDANGAVHSISSNTCDKDANDPGTGLPGVGTVNGQCTITFTSNTAGTVTGHASADVDLDGETKHVETDGTGSNSGNAVKRFVDAKISIGPDDTNSVGENHTFTVNVQQNDGLTAAQGGDGVTGFGPAPNGTTPSVTLTNSGGAVNTISSNTCASPGTVNGTCSVTFTSNTAGTVTGHATVTFSVSTISLTRATDQTHGSSGDATKVFIAGSLAWFKVDNAGVKQAGATFEVCRTRNFNTADSTFTTITPVCVSVADDSDGTVGPGLDRDPDAGEFLIVGLRLGTYTVHETAAPPGFEPDPKTETRDVTSATLVTIPLSSAFVNQRPILKLTEFGYTNTPTGTPTAGVRSGTTVYTVKVKNFGGASVALSGTLAATTDSVGGTLACTGGNTKSLSATLGTTSPSFEATFTLSCTYTNLDDGSHVTANLSALNYTTNGVTRTASGTPATISFTVQGD